MRKYVKKIVKHPLISGSTLVFAGSFIVNFLNYIFNLIMGRLLPIDQYGLLVSLTSFISIIGIFQTSLIQLFAKFSAQYTARKSIPLKRALFRSGLKITAVLSFILFVVLIAIIIPFSEFLHVDNYFILILTFVSSSFIILISLPLGVLQGELRFIPVSVLNVIIVTFRITLGISLVIIGLGATGGILALMLSLIISYVVSFYFHKSYAGLKDSASHPRFLTEFRRFSLPFLLASLGVIVLQSTDVILVRHFLTQEDAGLFAALSLMGKAIFYITSPIFFAFFPLIAQKKERNEGTTNTLILAFGIVFLCNLFFYGVYTIFPSFIISFFFPQPVYQQLAPYLGLYAFYIMVFSAAFLLYNYYLSLGETRIYKLSLSCTLVYFVLIFFFHNSIQEFINTLIFSSLLLLLLLLVYYRKINRNKL